VAWKSTYLDISPDVNKQQINFIRRDMMENVASVAQRLRQQLALKQHHINGYDRRKLGLTILHGKLLAINNISNYT